MEPRHIAIILDGNRRFAKRLMLEPWKGHDHGKKKVEELLEWCRELGIKEVTLYTFSIQNFNRPKEEFDYLMGIIKNAFIDFLKDRRLEENGIRVKVIGRYNMFPRDVVEILKEVMEKTKHCTNYTLNFALAYGGREELTDTMKKIAKKVSDGDLSVDAIDEKTIEENLYMSSEPDLIIRTGGEKRTSNFLMWQASYSEWFFIDRHGLNSRRKT